MPVDLEAIPHLSVHTASNSILPLQIHKSFTIYHRKLLIIFNAALSLINHIYKLRYELLLTRHYSLKHNSILALCRLYAEAAIDAASAPL